MSRHREQFCKRGHDTDITGRDAHGYCKECRKEWDRRRSPEKRAKERAKANRERKESTRPDWERARVARWLEIVSVDKMEPNKSTQQRRHDFDKRYEKLEADVPTPENV